MQVSRWVWFWMVSVAGCCICRFTRSLGNTHLLSFLCAGSPSRDKFHDANPCISLVFFH